MTASIMGGINALYPVVARDEVDFLQRLEMAMRADKPPLCGNDHMKFRSSYFPVQNCIDGDLCEQFSLLPLKDQQALAAGLDRTPAEVLKKLEEIRNRIL